MGKKSAAMAVSKISSSAAPSTASSSHASSKSSILKSSFAPSSLQLHLFASIIQSFDSQQLRLHDINSGRLRQQHSARPGTTITSLDWGYYAVSHREDGKPSSKKKRKRAQGAEDAVLAYGTSDSDICMYSPTEGRVVHTLSGGHELGIRDFKFNPNNQLEAWSIGGDGKLVRWDLSKNQVISSIALPDSSVSILSQPSKREPQILCASTTPFSISPAEDFRIDTFDSFKLPIHSLQRSRGVSSSEYFLAADHDRYINVFDIDHRKLVRTLVTGSEVEKLDISSGQDGEGEQVDRLLAVVTRDGVVELFSHPFKIPTVVNGDVKSKRKNMTRKAVAQVKMVDASKKLFRILAISIQGSDLVVVSVDGGVEPAFQKVRWQDEGTGELLFEGVKEITKIRSASSLNSAQMNGVKDMGKTHVDDSKTVVVNGAGNLQSQNDDTIEISSDGEDEEAESDEESDAKELDEDDADASNESEEDNDQPEQLAIEQATDTQEDAEMEDAADEEPSFGDLLAAKHPTTIAIADSFATEKFTSDARKQLALPSGMSLGTVLTQALRTNDTNLLESCLHASDAGIIQNTVQRLDSTLAATLLSKLAERLASRPGRYGHLLSWVQWTCIAHGGAIASQSDVTSKIRTLYRVLTQRSKSLDKLLLLKGKLDMLDAQLTLRKQLQAQRGTQIQDQGEPGMIYIEGEEDNWSSDEDIDEAVGVAKKAKSKKSSRRALEDLVADAVSEGEDDEEMPIVNGVSLEDSDSIESDDEMQVTGRTKGMYDVEAEVSGEEDASEDEDEEGDDVDESDDEDDEEEDSSLDSFINDDEIDYESAEDEIDLDDEPEVRRPEKKRSKHR